MKLKRRTRLTGFKKARERLGKKGGAWLRHKPEETMDGPLDRTQIWARGLATALVK